MATADEDANPEAGTTTIAEDPRPSLGWADSVSNRPIGLGGQSEVVAWAIDSAKPASLLVVANGGRSARLFHPVENGEGYDEGALIEGLDGLRCLTGFTDGPSGFVGLIAIAAEGLVLLRNEGEPASPRFPTREPLGLPTDLGIGVGHVAQLQAVDWDGNGRIDLLVGCNTIDRYWDASPAVPVEQQVGFDQSGAHPGYDSEGRWRGQPPTGRIFWLKNVGESGHPRFELQPELVGEGCELELGLHPAPLAVSWGGGDNLELMVLDEGGLVRIHRNFGGQRPPVLMEPRIIKLAGKPLANPEGRTTIHSVSLDSGRRSALLFGSIDGPVFAIRSTSRDAAAEPVALLQAPGSFWVGGHAIVAPGDIDGDGGLDLVVGLGSGRMVLFRDHGHGSEHRYSESAPIEAGGIPFVIGPGVDGQLGGPVAPRLGYACPTLADWTGNGRLDLIVSGASGEIGFLRNDGSATQPRFATPVGLRCEGGPLIVPPRVRPAVADWFGDGRIGLVTLDLQGFLCFYPALDEKNLNAPIPLVDRLGRVVRLDGGFGLAGRCSIWAGPWTRPDQIDLLVGLGRAAARFVLPGLTGRSIAEGEQAATVFLLENQGRGGLIPRLIMTKDGQPIVLGFEGCSPSGVPRAGAGPLDLLVGSDDGHVHYFLREEIRW